MDASLEARENLGRLIRGYRQRCGLSQAELAERIEPPLDSDTISNLERGRTRPFRHTLERVCAALGLSAADQQQVLESWRRHSAPAWSQPLGTPLDANSAHNLPLRLTSFVGRERDELDLTTLLLTQRLLTLTGAGGVGKTRLALQVAEHALSQHPDGVRFVDLAPLGDSSLVLAAVGAKVGASEQPGQQPLDTLVEVLRDRRLLLVIDNCEHLVEGCAELVSALLSLCPGLRILTTSRESLAVPGEMVWQVPPLSFHDKGTCL